MYLERTAPISGACLCRAVANIQCQLRPPEGVLYFEDGGRFAAPGELMFLVAAKKQVGDGQFRRSLQRRVQIAIQFTLDTDERFRSWDTQEFAELALPNLGWNVIWRNVNGDRAVDRQRVGSGRSDGSCEFQLRP